MKTFHRVVLVVSSLFVSASAFAIDTAAHVSQTANIAKIDAVKADLVAYAGALLVLGVAVWAVMKVVRMFRGK